MKYFSLNTVENAYKGISTHTNNKFWGILAITSSIGSVVSSQRVFNLNIDNVSNLLENQFCLVENPKKYSRGYSWNVIFSNLWAKYVSSKLLKYSPNIYDVLVWYFRRESFEDTITLHELLSLFFEKTNISVEVAKSIFNFNEKEITFASTKYTENQLLTSLNSFCNNASNYTTITAEKSFVAANAGELSRAPFIQTLYAGQGAQECMILTQFNFNDYYGNYGDSLVEKTNTKQLGTALFTFDDPTKFVWECIKYFNKQDCLKELFESKWFARSGFYNNYYTINGCFVAKEDTEGGEFENIEIFNNVLINNNFEVRTQEQVDGFIEAVNILFSGRYKILKEGDFENATYKLIKTTPADINLKYLPYLAALRTKPFMLLAGISGTGKSRIARQIAKACWALDSEERTKQVPSNFCMIQVKPNWHDSTELLGYVSRIEGEKYVAGKFLPFVAKAWENLDTPHILCLDEMNLAPVEQYFAEYLSVIESRKLNEDGTITTDPIITAVAEQWFWDLVQTLTSDGALQDQFKKEGITLPPNLFVIGTVNMDETTFSFSRKVLDRAMTIEMNEVDLEGGLTQEEQNELGEIGNAIIGLAVEGKDVYEDHKDYCDQVIEYLKLVNEELENTPFKIAYRTRNEFLLYAVNRKAFDNESSLQTALDEMTSMKILPRIEGDSERVKTPLEALRKLMQERGWDENESISLKKIKEMLTKLQQSGYTSYWT